MSVSRAACLLAAMTALAGCARSCAGGVATRKDALLYASDEERGDVIVIDAASAKVVGRIAVGKRPRGLRLSPDGKRLYVALSGSPRVGPGVDESKLPPADRTADGIGVIDLAGRRIERTFESGQDPESFDLSPDGKTLFVSNEETAQLTAIEVSNGAIRGRASVGGEPEGVAVRPDGKVVFVTSERDNEVDAVDTGTFQVVAKVPTGPRPRSIAFSKDGRTAFVTSELGPSVSVIDAVAYEARAEIRIHLDSPMPSGPRPMGLVLSRDGKELYVTSGRGGSVAVIDVASGRQIRSFEGVGDRPWGIAIDANGRIVTANGTSADVSIVDPATGNVDKRVHTGGLPWGVVVGF